MLCPSCSLAFNKIRKPLVISCGHSFCSGCVTVGENSKCTQCGTVGKCVVNFALYQQVAKQNLTNIDKYVRICLFGNMNVGKTSVLCRLVDNEFQYHTNPTIGIDFKYVDRSINDKLYRFQIWDSAGQQRYRSMSSHHLKGSDIVILVYDVSRGYDENGLSYWIGEIENYAKHNNIIVVGNKIDLVEDSKMQQLQSTSKVSKLQPLLDSQVKNIEGFGWQHIKVSCLSNENISILWERIISKTRINSRLEEEKKTKETQEDSLKKISLKKGNKNNYKSSESPTDRCC